MMVTMKKGMFVAFEGIDGSGTTTQSAILARNIRELSPRNSVLVTPEPWESERIHEILKVANSPYSKGSELAKLFVGDRVNHSRRLIKPCLEKGVFVLGNRYRMSTDAYQSAQGLDLDELMELQRDHGVLTPDITFFIDVNRDFAMDRVSSRGKPLEKFERDFQFIDSLMRQYRKCVEIGKKNKCIYGDVYVINGNKSVKDTSLDILHIFGKMYTEKGY
jgi:dTMP kinase